MTYLQCVDKDIIHMYIIYIYIYIRTIKSLIKMFLSVAQKWNSNIQEKKICKFQEKKLRQKNIHIWTTTQNVMSCFAGY